MTAPLTPSLALAYLYELSVDVRAAVVLDRAGEPLAGDATLAARVRTLLAAAPGGRGADGSLLAARAADGGAIAVVAGPCAPLSLLGHDLAVVADLLSTGAAPDR